MSKENKENKEKQTYSGDSIVSKWLSGTWLGNLLGYPSNTYIDGYGTTRNYANLEESAQGQQLSRMKDTAKNYGKVALTGMSFGNPLVARSTIGAVLPTGAQSYFITEGLRDAYNRFMKKDKTAEDAVWTGLDLAGAIPAVGSVVRNGKYVFPEIKNNLNKQARIFARQYSDYQPTTQLSNIPAGEPSKPFTYLWELDQSDAINLKDVGKYEDAVTAGFKDAQDIFLNKEIFNSLYTKPRKGITRTYDLGDISPKEFSEFSVWPENVRFKSHEIDTFGSTLAYRAKDGSRPFVGNWFRKTSSEAQTGGNIKFDALQLTPNELRSTATHEALHSKGLGTGIDPTNVYTNLFGKDFQIIINRNNRLKYLYKYPEIAAHVLADWKHLNPIKSGQPLPKSPEEWDKFINQVKEVYAKTNNDNWMDEDFHNFLREIIYERDLLSLLGRSEEIQKLDKQLFEILNGTAF